MTRWVRWDERELGVGVHNVVGGFAGGIKGVKREGSAEDWVMERILRA